VPDLMGLYELLGEMKNEFHSLVLLHSISTAIMMIIDGKQGPNGYQ